MEAAMPNLKEKKEALELAQKENLNWPKEMWRKTPRNIQKWQTETEKANLAYKATQEEIAKQKQVLHEATQAAEQAWAKEKDQDYRNRIKRKCRPMKSEAKRNCKMSKQAIKVVAHLDAATTEKQKNQERIQLLEQEKCEDR